MISVIVPVYNLERFLDATVESILRSTYQDLELILVDDGSMDGSAVICDEFASRDSRVKVIHKQNGGVASARNEGLKVARGEYISFVDGDDVIHPDMLRILLNALQQGAYDFSMCYLKRVHEDEAIDFKQTSSAASSSVKTLSGDDYIRGIYGKNIDVAVQYDYNIVFNKLFKRELIAGELFAQLRMAEDIEWLHRVCLKAKSAVIVEEELYYYMQRESSLTHAQMNPKFIDVIRCYYLCLDSIPLEKKEFRRLCMAHLYKVMALIRYKSYQTPYEKDVIVLNTEVYKNTRSEFKMLDIDVFTKWRLLTFLHQPWTYRLFTKGCDMVAKFIRR